MSVKNFYPEKPEIPYKKTKVPMEDIITYLQSLSIPVEIKRITYVVFRNESFNGKSGVNNNYAGIQADNARWAAKFDESIVATCVQKENNGKVRRFVCFRSWHDSLNMTIDRMKGRGIYVGGFASRYAKMKVEDSEDLVRAYYKEWVKGDFEAEPTILAAKNFRSMYSQAVELFK